MVYKLLHAVEYALGAYGDIERPGGDRLINHALRVAMMVAQKMDEPSLDNIISALLHDVIEDTNVTYEELNDEFGSEVALTVRRLTKPTGENRKNRMENYRRQMSEGVHPTQFIKACDILDNMRDTSMLAQPFKRMYINECALMAQELNLLKETKIEKELNSTLLREMIEHE